MNHFFTSIHGLLRDKEQFKFQLTREAERLCVLVTPLLGEEPDDLSEEAQQARAALSVPLLLRMSAAELDGTFGAKLTGYIEARSDLSNAYAQLIDGLTDAGKNAKNATTQVVAKSTGTSKKLPKPKATVGKESKVEDGAVPGKDEPASAATDTAPGTTGCNPVSIL